MTEKKKYSMISNFIVSKRVTRFEVMLKESLTWMNDELNNYIGITYEVPFFFNERSILGFFISGLTRNSDTIVLQEFACFKNRKQNNKKVLGRADLYFYYKKVSYLVECKWRWSRFNKGTNFKSAFDKAKSALKQVSNYTNDAKVSKKNIFSLCFEAVGFNRYALNKKYKEGIEKWKIKNESDLRGLDFYALIEVTKNVKSKWCFYDDPDQLYFPALAIYGMFNTSGE